MPGEHLQRVGTIARRGRCPELAVGPRAGTLTRVSAMTAASASTESVALPRPEDEVVRICRDLIRIDSSNYGDGSGPGERAAAEYVMGLLTEVGLEPTYSRATPAGRASWSGVEGADRDPAAPVRPRPPRRRAGQRRRLDGRPVRGRGARRLRVGPRRRRHEGHGRDDPGRRAPPGAHRHRAAARPGRSRSSPTRRPAASRARTGWSTTIPSCSRAPPRRSARSAATSPSRPRRASRRTYLLQTAEKGIAWLRLRRRTAGPGTARCPTTRTPSCRLAAAIARIGAARLAARVHRLGAHAARRAVASSPASRSDEDPDELLEPPRRRRGVRRGTLQDTANPTDARRRLQAQRHPAARRRPRRLPLPARPRGRPDGDHPRAGRASTSTSRCCTTTSRSTRRSRATWSTRWSRPCWPRTPTPTCCRTACPAAPTTRRCRARHHRLRVRAAAAARRPRLRADVPRRRRAGAGGRRCASAPGCCSGCSRPADASAAGDARSGSRRVRWTPDDAAAQPDPAPARRSRARAVHLPAAVLGVLGELPAGRRRGGLPGEGRGRGTRTRPSCHCAAHDPLRSTHDRRSACRSGPPHLLPRTPPRRRRRTPWRDDPAVVAAYQDVADAFDAYDDALLEAYGEVTPLEIYGGDEDDDDDDEDEDDDEARGSGRRGRRRGLPGPGRQRVRRRRRRRRRVRRLAEPGGVQRRPPALSRGAGGAARPRRRPAPTPARPAARAARTPARSAAGPWCAPRRWGPPRPAGRAPTRAPPRWLTPRAPARRRHRVHHLRRVVVQVSRGEARVLTGGGPRVGRHAVAVLAREHPPAER